MYVRPSFYKSTKAIGVRLHHLEHELYVIATPFGNYIDIEKGVRVMSSSWRRNADEALPARGKLVGGYVNMAFQKSEAELNGFDEALVMTPDGHASEGSAANLFVVRDGVLLTPPVSDDILEGVTRKAILQLAADLGIPTEVRSIDRSELYVCDEMFLSARACRSARSSRSTTARSGTGAVGAITRRDQRALLRRRARHPARVPRLADARRELSPAARESNRPASRGAGRACPESGAAVSRPRRCPGSARPCRG